MAQFAEDIDRLTRENQFFMRVLFTTERSQLVVMVLQPGEDTGLDAHGDADQFIRFLEGRGKTVVDGREKRFAGGWALVVPAGAIHNIQNTSRTEMLKFYSIYSKPLYLVGTTYRTRAEAEAAGLEAERKQAPASVASSEEAPWDRVAEASVQSFPASDAPAHLAG